MTTVLRTFALVAVLAMGCAHQERQIIRLQPGAAVDLQNFDMKRQSLIIELRAGEVIPLEVTVDGDYVATEPGASLPMTVKRTCYVRVDDRGMRLSDDGQNFDEKPRVPGSFQFGVGATKDGKKATLRLTTPSR